MHYRADLDLTFHALADGTRRSMIRALARGETRSAGELGRHFGSAQIPAVLCLAGLRQATFLKWVMAASYLWRV